ncbi:MAG: DUF2807 domain-containing protein [Bacteroidales bacterium]|nr:DUF2807 domain-containing protein [Bacteroidales bacterium]
MKTTISKTKKIIIASVYLIISICSVHAQTDSTVEKSFPGLKGIDVRGYLKVDIQQGDNEGIKIVADKINFEAIKTVLKDGILKIYTDGELKGKTYILVTAKEFKSITAKDVTTITGLSLIKTEKIDLKSEGLGRITIDLEAAKANIYIDGAGGIVIKGKTETAEINSSGAGRFNGDDFEIQKCKISASGASNIKLNVVKELDAKVTGASNLKYKGKPELINKTISGVGKIIGYSNPNDSTIYQSEDMKIILGDKKIIIGADDDEDDGEHHHHSDTCCNDINKKCCKTKIRWFGVDIGINGYLNAENKTEMYHGYDFLKLDYAKSMVVNVNFLQFHFKIIKNYVNLVSGLGFELNNYRFENNYNLLPDSARIDATEETAYRYKKNKLVVNFLTAPLLLQFDTKQNKKYKSFHLSAGVVGGYRIGSHTKRVITRRNIMPKIHDDFNLAPFRYSALVKIGYGDISIFGTYSFSNLFEEKEGPVLHPFSAGLSFNI